MQRAKARVILRWFVTVAALGGAAAFFLWRRSADDAPVSFKLGTVDRGAVEQVVTATGQLSAVVTVQVGSQVSGIIQSLNADFNSQVKEGQVIAQIDPTRFRANVEQQQASLKHALAAAERARVNFEQAGREYARAKALAEKQVIGEAEFEGLRSKYDLTRVETAAAEAQVAQARAALNAARVDLERTTIRAPISGTVLQRAVDVGQTVAASLQAPTLFTIAQDLAKMEVRAQVDESDVGKLREGLEARFNVDAYPGREFVATIHQIRSNPNMQQNVVTYDAILRVDNPDGRLRPGMTANVRIVSERREDVLRIPNAALRFKPPPDMVLASAAPGGPPGRAGDGGAVSGERQRWAGRGEAAGRSEAGSGRVRRAGGGAEGGREGRVIARVYRAAGEKVSAVPFRPGIADDEYTEVVWGQLSQGDEIVVEAIGGAFRQGAAQQRSTNPMSRGRGPRLF